MKKLITLSGLVLGLSPVMALAQGVIVEGSGSACTAGGVGTLFGIICRLGQLLNAIVPVLIALGIVYFIWGVITYVVGSDEEAKKTGRDRMIFGIIGLAVIVAVWGLVNILRNTFNINNNATIQLPTVPIVVPGGNQ